MVAAAETPVDGPPRELLFEKMGPGLDAFRHPDDA